MILVSLFVKGEDGDKEEIVNGDNVNGIFNLIQESVTHMKKSMNELDYDFSSINEKTRQL